MDPLNDFKIVYTEGGSSVAIAGFVGGGTEGSVFRIDPASAGGARKLAKLYEEDPEERRDKIEAMVSMYPSICSDDTLKYLAWPIGTLYSDDSSWGAIGLGRGFIGFGMKELPIDCSFSDLVDYSYPPKNGISVYDKVTLAIDLCNVTEILHSCGLVQGDWNPKNFCKIEGEMRIGIMDVDSFHVKSGGVLYPCVVSTPGYNAPDLLERAKGRDFKDCPGETFTVQTDNWCVAVLVHRLLFNGAHPYSGSQVPDASGSLPAPVSVDEHVRRGDAPLWKRVPKFGIPPYVPLASSMPDFMRKLFTRAFVTGHNKPEMRPSSAEWRDALIRYRNGLVQCPKVPSHWYWRSAHHCPYCDADQRFASVYSSASSSGASSSGGGLSAWLSYSGTAFGSPGGTGNPFSRDNIRLLGRRYWSFSIGVALLACLFVGEGIGLARGVSKSLLGVDSGFVHLFLVIGGLAFAIAYNNRSVWSVSATSALKSAVAAVIGMLVFSILLSMGLIYLYFVLAIFIVSIVVAMIKRA